MSWLEFAGVATAGAAGWLALYRLPLRRPRTRQRFRLAVASRTGLPARYVFPVVGTGIYLGLGILAAVAVAIAAPAGLGGALVAPVTGRTVATTLLVAVGAMTLIGFAMTMLYAARPTVDVPGAVAGVHWIREVLALPPAWRWLAPMSSAAVEEFYFRGVFLTGLLLPGAPVWVAIGVSGAVFTAGQVLLTERALPALVLGLSSVVLSVLCGLLVVVTGTVLPAIVVHASFAGFYTNLGADRRVVTG
ncbi:MAG TPA: CPBP family glutamic-type intramembrane protease [Natronosporangium sp.]